MAIKAYYRLNGNSNDASGNGNNGTDTNVAYSQANGRLNQGAGFNGSSSVIQCADSPSLSFTGAFTISMWIKPTALPSSGGLMSLVCKYDAPTNNNSGYDLRLYNDAGTQKIGLVTGNGVSYGGGDIAYNLGTGSWRHLVGVYGNGYSRIYVDGIYIGQVSNSINPRDGSKLLNIGNFGYYTPTLSVLPRWFNGSLDEIILDAAAWSPAQIKNEYSRIKGFF